MADEADVANDRLEKILQARIEEAQWQLNNVTSGTGECWNCGEEVDANRRWCNAECREDWQVRNRSV
jgi:RNA polymerase-binding transcription factor DksA